MSHITLHAPAPVAVPRGAEWAASAFATLLGYVERVWTASSERQAHSQRIDEAVALRRLAADVSRYDPSFAADLFAAADRHIDRIGVER
jgi:hypothetical protein